MVSSVNILSELQALFLGRQLKEDVQIDTVENMKLAIDYVINKNSV